MSSSDQIIGFQILPQEGEEEGEGCPPPHQSSSVPSPTDVFFKFSLKDWLHCSQKKLKNKINNLEYHQAGNSFWLYIPVRMLEHE